MEQVRFPKISANVEEATITRWAVAEGDYLEKGQLLMEVTTDKGVVEVEAPTSGVVRQLIAAENSTVPVGYIVALIGEVGEPLPDVAPANARLMATHRERVATPARSERPRGEARRVVVRATPAARRMAREKGLDLAEVKEKTGADIINETVLDEYLARTAD